MKIAKIIVEDLNDILDLVLWTELESLCIDNPDDRAWINSKLRKLEASGGEFFGCYKEDRLIGFATILIEDRPASACDGYGACELLQLGIRGEYRKGGYGSKMLQFIEQYLKERKVYCLYMHTYASDYSVVAFYGKNGYIPRGVVPDVYGPKFDGMLYMSKPLAD
ncbi:MAG TPA: GNAT family N-acetyltransferase [Lachnospiraceae bacterium]|nr:GNAT family N-acetyltransferase [Lachnospiraceae bacterium]